MNYRVIALASAIAYAAFINGPAYAQTEPPPPDGAAPDNQSNQAADLDSITDVVVTARRVEESMQSTPVAVTALTALDLERNQTDDLNSVQYSAPGVLIATYPGDPSSVSIQLRGQVQSDLVATNDPAVGVYFDGTYLGRGNGGSLNTIDLARVEILRGPQGTLFGRNTTGGAINIVPNNPTNELEGSVGIRVGNYDLFEINGVLNLPIGDDAAARLVFLSNQRDGYARSRYTGQRLLDDDETAGRVRLRLNPTESLQILIAGDYSRRSGNGTEYKLVSIAATGNHLLFPTVQPGVDGGRPLSSYIDGDLFRNDSNRMSFYDATIWGVSLTADLELTDTITLRSITSYRELERVESHDFDGTPYIILEGDRSDLRQDQFSQEVQLNGRGFDSRLTYTLGAFYFSENARDITNNDAFIGLGPPPFTRGRVDGEVENDSYAIYGQATFELFPDFRLTAGLRYTMDERGIVWRNLATRHAVYDGPIIAEICSLTVVVRDPGTTCQATRSDDFDYISYTFGADYQATPDLLLYFRSGRSYKSGGFNIRSTTVPDSFAPFQPEQLTDYELGVKADLIPGRLRVNAAAYYSLYRNMQRTLQVPTPAGPNPTANFVTNAEKAHVSGVEVEITARPVRGLQISLGAAYTDPVYDDYVDTAPPFIDRSNEPFVYVSKYSFFASVRYDFETPIGAMNLNGNYFHRSSFFFQPSDLAPQRAYSLTNAVVGWSPRGLEALELQAWVQNLFDKEYASNILDLQRSVGFTTITPGAPRTVGLAARFRF